MSETNRTPCGPLHQLREILKPRSVTEAISDHFVKILVIPDVVGMMWGKDMGDECYDLLMTGPISGALDTIIAKVEVQPRGADYAEELRELRQNWNDPEWYVKLAMEGVPE